MDTHKFKILFKIEKSHDDKLNLQCASKWNKRKTNRILNLTRTIEIIQVTYLCVDKKNLKSNLKSVLILKLS